MQRLKNRVALITGAASGIGRATAETLAREGARVIATDRNQAGVQAVVTGIQNAGLQARALSQDVASETVWADVIADIRLHEGALHVVVNNAGIAWAGSILDMSLDDWRKQQAINLEGVFLGIRSAVPLMRDSGSGSIINVSSVAGLKGSATLAGYCATKGGASSHQRSGARVCSFGLEHSSELGTPRHHRYEHLADRDTGGDAHREQFG